MNPVRQPPIPVDPERTGEAVHAIGDRPGLRAAAGRTATVDSAWFIDGANVLLLTDRRTGERFHSPAAQWTPDGLAHTA